LIEKIDSILIALKKVNAFISNHGKSFVCFNSQIDNFSGQISFLFEENKLINNRLSDLELKMPASSAEIIISEITERNLKLTRSLYLMSWSHLSFQQLLTPSKIIRLGISSNKPRPIRIELSSYSDGFSVLKLQHKLRDFMN